MSLNLNRCRPVIYVDGTTGVLENGIEFYNGNGNRVVLPQWEFIKMAQQRGELIASSGEEIVLSHDYGFVKRRKR